MPATATPAAEFVPMSANDGCLKGQRHDGPYEIRYPKGDVLCVSIHTCPPVHIIHPGAYKKFSESYEMKFDNPKRWEEHPGRTYCTVLRQSELLLLNAPGCSFPKIKIGGRIYTLNASGGSMNGGGWCDHIHQGCGLIIPTADIAEGYVRHVLDHAAPWKPEYKSLLPQSQAEKARERKAFFTKHADDWIVASAWGDWHEKVPKGFAGVLAYKGEYRSGPAPEEKGWFLVPIEEYQQRNGYGFVIDTARHQPWTDHA